MRADRELTQDELDALGIDGMRYEHEHGHPAWLSDLSQDELYELDALR